MALINRIIQVTENFGGSTTVQYDLAEDTLVIKKTERRNMLPDDLYALWAKKGCSAQEVSQKDPDSPERDYVGIKLPGEGTAQEESKTKPTELQRETNPVTHVAGSK